MNVLERWKCMHAFAGASVERHCRGKKGKAICCVRTASWGPLTEEELQQIVLGANHHLLLDPGALLLRFLVREPIHNR